MVLIIWEQWMEKLQEQLSLLYENKYLTDIVIQVGKKKCEVHSFVISLFSKLFQDILQEAYQLEDFELPLHISLTDVNFDALIAVLAFMYHGEISVEDELVTDILAIIDLLKVQGLEDMNAYFTNWLSSEPKVADCKKFSSDEITKLGKRIQADIIPLKLASDGALFDSTMDCLEMDIEQQCNISPVTQNETRNSSSKLNNVESPLKNSTVKRNSSELTRKRSPVLNDNELLDQDPSPKNNDIETQRKRHPVKLKYKVQFKDMFKRCLAKKPILHEEEEEEEEIEPINLERIKAEVLEEARICSDDNEKPWPLDHLAINLLTETEADCDDSSETCRDQVRKEMSYFWHKFLSDSDLERESFLSRISDKLIRDVCRELSTGVKVTDVLKALFLSSDDLVCSVFMLLYAENLSLQLVVQAYDVEIKSLRPVYEERVQRALKLYQTTELSLGEICNNCWVPCIVVKDEINKNNIDGFCEFDEAFQEVLLLSEDGLPIEKILAMNKISKFSHEFKGILRHQMGRIFSLPLPLYRDRIENAVNAWTRKSLTLEEAARENIVSYRVLRERISCIESKNFIADMESESIFSEKENDESTPVATLLPCVLDSATTKISLLGSKIEAEITPLKTALSKAGTRYMEINIVNDKSDIDFFESNSSAQENSVENCEDEFVENSEESTSTEVPFVDSEMLKVELLREAVKYIDEEIDHWPLEHLSIEYVPEMNKDGGDVPEETSKICLVNEMSYFWNKFTVMSGNERKEFLEQISQFMLLDIYKKLLTGIKITEIFRSMSYTWDVFDCAVFLLLYSKFLNLKLADDAYNVEEVSLKSLYKDRIERALCLYQTTARTIREICNTCWVPYKFVKADIIKTKAESFTQFDETIQDVFRLRGKGVPLDKIFAEDEICKKYSEEFKAILQHQVGKNITLPLHSYENRIKEALNAWENKSVTVHEAARNYMVAYSTLCKRILSTKSKEITSPHKVMEDFRNSNKSSPKMTRHKISDKKSQNIAFRTLSAKDFGLRLEGKVGKPWKPHLTRATKFKEQINAVFKSVKEGMTALEAFKLHRIRNKRYINIFKYNIERPDSVLHIDYDTRVLLALDAVKNGEINCNDAGREFCVNSTLLRYYNPKGSRTPAKRIVLEKQMKGAILACREGTPFDEACKKFKINTPKYQHILQYNLETNNPPIDEPYSVRIQKARDAIGNTDITVTEAADVYLVNAKALLQLSDTPGKKKHIKAAKWQDQMTAAIKSVQEGISVSRAFRLHGLKDRRKNIGILKYNADREDSVLHIHYDTRFQMAVKAMKSLEMNHVEASRHFCVNGGTLRYYEPKNAKVPNKKYFFEHQMKEAILACRKGMDFDEVCKKFRIDTQNYRHILRYNLQVENPPVDESYSNRMKKAKDAVCSAEMTIAEAASVHLVNPRALNRAFMEAKKENNNIKQLKESKKFLSPKVDRLMLEAIRSCRNGMSIEKSFKMSRLKNERNLECLRFNVNRADAPINVSYADRLKKAVAAMMQKRMNIEEASRHFIIGYYALARSYRMSKKKRKEEGIHLDDKLRQVPASKSIRNSKIFKEKVVASKLNSKNIVNKEENSKSITLEITEEKKSNGGGVVHRVHNTRSKELRIQVLKRYSKGKVENSLPRNCSINYKLLNENKKDIRGPCTSTPIKPNEEPSTSTAVKSYEERFQLALQACLSMSMKRSEAAKKYQVNLTALNESYEIEWHRKHTSQPL